MLRCFQMHGEPCLSLEQLAALTVRMEGGVARDRVLAEAGIAADAWEGARAAWLARMAQQAGRNSRALHLRYTELLYQLRSVRPAHGSAQSVAGPTPVAPIAHLSPLHAHPQLGAGGELREQQSAVRAPAPHAAQQDAAVQTAVAALTAHSDPLPFLTAGPTGIAASLSNSPLPLAGAGSHHDTGTMTVSSGMESQSAWKPPLPFQPAAPGRRPTLPGEQTSVPEPVLSLVQYASLCAELAVFPHASESIFAGAGLADRSRRTAEDAVWKERLRADPGAYRAWEEHYRHYYTVWTAEAHRRGGR